MSVDKLLEQISESLDSTSAAVEGVLESFEDNKDATPELVNQILKSIQSKSDTNPMEPVSLLSLKNTSLLGYITDLALLLSLRLKSMEGDDDLSSKKDELTKSSVTHRVTLERGVKSLEKKLSYQLEKLTAAYQRKEKEQKDIENNVHKQSNEDQSEDDKEEEQNEEDDDENSEDEGLNFKPNLGALMGSNNKGIKKSFNSRRQAGKQDEEEEEEEEYDEDDEDSGKSKGKYKPPKIAAMALQSDPDKEVKSKKQRNLQSMDEYLQDISDAPMAEKSIGATIVNQGRDMKTKRQLEKEAQIKRYEEENFTRLPAQKVKENKRDRSKRMRNEFFGEDWSMFDNNREFTNNDNPAKKRKPQNSWDKAKRKIN